MQRFVLRWTIKRGFATTAMKEDPPLTEERYRIQRGNYNQLSMEHTNRFQQLLGGDKARVLTDPYDVHPHNVDWLNSMRGRSSVVLQPKSTQEVSALLKYCNEQRLAVCPQGGNTGLVGGSTPVFDEVVISTSLMNKIISIDSAA
ncbi:D-2-hydroxyglutarate dehydrogenase, mitochondrial-like, partial [Ctenocephalides felis]|uniref:D-2-hydroxyglutarate dehydrogenase, mitochondrial-like n=1 Tax=Ctenocephalides felis TaxID=7515 RepID=UPI000E6E5AC1